MTIAIAAAGSNAGRAVFEGLKAAEKVGTQSIGGFVAFAALTKKGTLERAETQRGGSSTLFVDGERNGVEPPRLVGEAVAAGLISSGPDRPTPLSQFVTAAAGIGLVTGHRLPTALGVNGKPMNMEALELLQAGQSAQEAVDAVVGQNPTSDCGLIAIDSAGRVYGRSSARVTAHPDAHQAEGSLDHGPGKVIALQNAIQPNRIVAEVAVAVALHVMRGPIIPDEWIAVASGLPISVGSESAVHCDADLNAQFVVTTDPTIVAGEQAAAAVYLNSAVFRDGKLIGYTVGELLCFLRDGKIVSFSGQERSRIGFVLRPGAID
jgi:hypothetical protein